MTAGSLAAAARLTTGVVLACSGLAKLISWRGSERQLAGLGVPASMAPAAAAAVPVAELVVSALVLGVPARWPVWLAIGAFALFTGVLVAELQRGTAEPCRCFGSLSTRPMSARALIRNAWLLALAVLATGTTDGLAHLGWLVAPLVVVSAVLILTT